MDEQCAGTLLRLMRICWLVEDQRHEFEGGSTARNMTKIARAEHWLPGRVCGSSTVGIRCGYRRIFRRWRLNASAKVCIPGATGRWFQTVYQPEQTWDSREGRYRLPWPTHLTTAAPAGLAENDLMDFPRRMRDWLFNVMRDLAARNELPEAYMELEHEAENNMTKRWTNAAIWKWCTLDGHPNDNSVSRHELFPIRAPLMALEHCIAPFLESCDPNNDHRISLQEWGNCLELEEDDLTARCAKINKEDEMEKIELELGEA
ncbi:hypothetical protein pipiens_016315 [Culex pipiens pipiens]|uniref:SPARC/Testican calcium-binding domain-containing protein n=1 Tax=Culex pipiens pipiens TaxID=38569 RepID=A0ABD1CMR1_CULPP